MTRSTSAPSTRFPWLSKPLCLLLCAALLCLHAPTARATNVDSTLTVGIQSTKTMQLRPLDPQERDLMSVYDLVYESLVVIDDNYLPQPGLAESWEMSSGGRTWTFHLRANVFFSDGTPLKAGDVVATLQQILNRANEENSTNRGFYQNLRYFVDSVSAKDDETMVIKTKSERSYWGVLYAMTFPILKASEVEADSPLGTGPYMFNTFEPCQYIGLTVNPHWWQNRPHVEDITFICYDTPKAVVESYEYARVNTIFTRSVAAAQYKSGTSSLALDYRTNQLECLLMNHSYGILSSVNVRKAIRYAVDIDKIASTVYMGMVDRTNTPFINGTWMYNSNLDSQFTLNLAEARRLLEEDGWLEDSDDDGALDKLNEKGEKISLKLRLYVYEEPDNDVRIPAADMIVDQLAQIGIVVTRTTMTYTGIQESLNAGSFHLALVSYAMDACPDYGFLLIGGNTGNYCRYRSSEMGDLCKKLRKTTSQAEYQRYLYDIQSRFVEDCPFICLFYRSGTVLTRKMYTTARDVRELELLRGIEAFHP